MTFKVPFLADAQIESATQELLRRYTKWKGAPPRPPIPVDAIVEVSKVVYAGARAARAAAAAGTTSGAKETEWAREASDEAVWAVRKAVRVEEAERALQAQWVREIYPDPPGL
jgi:hypothetical protein